MFASRQPGMAAQPGLGKKRSLIPRPVGGDRAMRRESVATRNPESHEKEEKTPEEVRPESKGISYADILSGRGNNSVKAEEPTQDRAVEAENENTAGPSAEPQKDGGRAAGPSAERQKDCGSGPSSIPRQRRCDKLPCQTSSQFRKNDTSGPAEPDNFSGMASADAARKFRYNGMSVTLYPIGTGPFLENRTGRGGSEKKINQATGKQECPVQVSNHDRAAKGKGSESSPAHQSRLKVGCPDAEKDDGWTKVKNRTTLNPDVVDTGAGPEQLSADASTEGLSTQPCPKPKKMRKSVENTHDNTPAATTGEDEPRMKKEQKQIQFGEMPLSGGSESSNTVTPASPTPAPSVSKAEQVQTKKKRKRSKKKPGDKEKDKQEEVAEVAAGGNYTAVSATVDAASVVGCLPPGSLEGFERWWGIRQRCKGSERAKSVRWRLMIELFRTLFGDVDVRDIDFYRMFCDPSAVHRWAYITTRVAIPEFDGPQYLLRMSARPHHEAGNREIRLVPAVAVDAIEGVRDILGMNDWIEESTGPGVYFYDLLQASIWLPVQLDGVSEEVTRWAERMMKLPNEQVPEYMHEDGLDDVLFLIKHGRVSLRTYGIESLGLSCEQLTSMLVQARQMDKPEPFDPSV